jgi:hypothetical protein
MNAQIVEPIEPPKTWTRASASLVFADSALSLRGNVDVISLEQGIEGWAVDLSAPQTLLRLQLLAGDQVIAESATGLSRGDVVSLLGTPASPGFRFPAAVLADLDDDLAKLPLRLKSSASI